MNFQIACLNGGEITAIAFVLLFPAMYFFVNLQISWPVWRKVTLVTFKWFSPVCFLRWVLRVPLSENVFPHGWHSISFLSGLHSILILFLSLWRKWRDWGSIFLRNVKSKKKQSLHYSKSLKVKVSCQIQRVTKCWYALIITIIIIIFITTHYYIKQQFLVLGNFHFHGIIAHLSDSLGRPRKIGINLGLRWC